jgi:hypothetical protein
MQRVGRMKRSSRRRRRPAAASRDRERSLLSAACHILNERCPESKAHTGYFCRNHGRWVGRRPSVRPSKRTSNGFPLTQGLFQPRRVARQQKQTRRALYDFTYVYIICMYARDNTSRYTRTYGCWKSDTKDHP